MRMIEPVWLKPFTSPDKCVMAQVIAAPGHILAVKFIPFPASPKRMSAREQETFVPNPVLSLSRVVGGVRERLFGQEIGPQTLFPLSKSSEDPTRSYAYSTYLVADILLQTFCSRQAVQIFCVMCSCIRNKKHIVVPPLF